MGRMTYNALQPPFPEHKPEDQPARQAAVENELKFHTARLDVAAIQNLYDVHDTAEMREELRSALNVSEALDAQQREIVQDYYFHLYAFAKAKGFDAKKAGTLLSICREIFDADAATNAPSESMEKSFERLEAQLLRHAEFRPPKALDIFDEGDVQEITGWMLHNYFRHYKLYKAIFTKRRSDVFSQAAPFAVEAPREPLPLSSFLPLRVEVDMPEDAPAPAPGPAPAPAAALDTFEASSVASECPPAEPMPAEDDGEE